MSNTDWDKYMGSGRKRKSASVWSSNDNWDRYFRDSALSFGRGWLRLGQSLAIGKNLASFLRWGSKFKL